MAIEPPYFLLKEIKDIYAQENWKKLKDYLDCLDANIEQTVNQTINIINEGATSPWTQGSSTVGASSTEVLETIPLSSFTCLEYTICIKNGDGSLTKTLKLLARRDDMDIKDNIYAKNGDPIDIEINSVQISTNFQLEFVNNEAFSLDVSFIRIDL